MFRKCSCDTSSNSLVIDTGGPPTDDFQTGVVLPVSDTQRDYRNWDQTWEVLSDGCVQMSERVQENIRCEL